MNKNRLVAYYAIKKEQNRLFIILSIIGLVVYSSTIIYELSNPDTLWNGVYQRENWAWECSLGRYMLRIWQEMFGTIINPTTFSIISILIVAMIGVITTDILQIEGLRAVLAGIIILLSPAIAGTLTYHYCSLYYMIAYLFAMISCWIICKKQTWYYSVAAMILLCLSMATYQAYIGIVAIIIGMFILGLILNENNTIKDIGMRIVYMVITIIGGVGIYLASNAIIQKSWGITAEAGRGFSKMGTIPINRLGELLKNCYIYTYQYFFSNEMINNSYGLKKEINIVLFGLLLILFIYTIIVCKKGWIYKALAIGWMAIIPLAVMCITIIAPEVSIYDTTGVIMLPTLNYMYVLLLFIGNYLKGENKALYTGRIASFILVGLISFSLFVYALTMQTYHRLCMNKMDYLSKEIATSIERVADNTSDYTLCFWGNIENGNYPEVYPELKERIKWSTASNGTIWPWYNWNPLSAPNCWIGYIKNYVGKEYRLCESEDYKNIIDSNILDSMNNFPDENSVAVYNESIIIIKLADM